MKSVIIMAFLSFLISGCATAPRVASVYPLPPPTGEGFYHTVGEGETLWRIAKQYNVEIGKIAQANRISDPSKVEAGQLLFIPRLKVSESENIAVFSKKGFIWPVKGKIASYFEQKRHNVFNNGIDILSYDGAPVVASGDGIISFCDDKVKGFGRTIIIDHGDGYSTVYAYNSENLVNAGNRVKKGQTIAKVGKSARSDEYILHFEIRNREKPQDPFWYLP